MTSSSRDNRLPPNIENSANGWHVSLDKRMDAYFEDVCVTRKCYYVVYMIADFALLGATYRLGRWALLWFSFFCLGCIVLHFYLILLLPTSGSRKRIVGVARMTHFDSSKGNQAESTTPLRRFALLTQHPNMPNWYSCTTFDIIIPSSLAWLLVVLYLFIVRSEFLFLICFLLVRLVIALHQYHTLATFYDAAVKANYKKHIEDPGMADLYAISRANQLCNADFSRANVYLTRGKAGKQALVRETTVDSEQQRRASRSRRVSFSGISMNTERPDAETPPRAPGSVYRI